jgi:hypothetical protein|tara:strand:+ start:3360 stop:3566 length:207 start_codon:yes stop_codon:yes gene_type:complete
MFSPGAIVLLSEVAKIQSSIETHDEIFGIVLECVNMGKLLGWPSDHPGCEVMTSHGVDVYSNNDLKEV